MRGTESFSPAPEPAVGGPVCYHVIYHVHTTALLKIEAFWDVMLRRWVSLSALQRIVRPSCSKGTTRPVIGVAFHKTQISMCYFTSNMINATVIGVGNL